MSPTRFWSGVVCDPARQRASDARRACSSVLLKHLEAENSPAGSAQEAPMRPEKRGNMYTTYGPLRP